LEHITPVSGLETFLTIKEVHPLLASNCQPFTL